MLEVLKAFFSCTALIISVYAFGVIILNQGKINKTYKDIISFIIICILNTIIFIYFEGTFKTILTCFIYALLLKLIFNSEWLKSIFSSIIYMILLIIPDLIIFATKIFGIDKIYFDANLAGTIISNLIVSALMIISIYILRKPIRKLINYKLSENMKIISVSLLTLITVAIFFYTLINSYRENNNIIAYIFILSYNFLFSTMKKEKVFIYPSPVLVIITLVITLFYLFKQKAENENILKKYDNLLDITKNYEKDIEEQRIINHESKNELLTIRSKLSNKNNKELCKYVDSIIGEKKSSKSARFSKLKYLPSNGLKGFFYYKLTEAEQKGINVSINVSKQIENSFINNINTKDFKDLSRIIGVYLDNAIEASLLSKEKKLGIEIYLIKNTIEMIFTNTYNYPIEKDKVGKEKYSTKGKNRGHGLLLVSRILKENDIFISETKITEKLYIQTLKIKDRK